jgi:hypothetical protein
MCAKLLIQLKLCKRYKDLSISTHRVYFDKSNGCTIATIREDTSQI